MGRLLTPNVSFKGNSHTVADMSLGSPAPPRAGCRSFAVDDGYEDARRIWNAVVDKRPALIAGCRTVLDIVSCVHFARDHALPMSVAVAGTTSPAMPCAT
jgi:hypothetical protein